MELEDQICSLGQAKRLKEIGVVKEGIFTFLESGKTIEIKMTSEIVYNYATYDIKGYSAFTVAELGVMVNSYNYGHSFFNDIGKSDRKYWAHTWSKGVGAEPILGWFFTEAEARAAMLIHLLENNLITAEEVNQRLTR